jgi:hypothetical protein
MANDGGGRDLYDRLMAASGEAMAAGLHGAAYHALMAALNVAQDSKDISRLQEIAIEAEEQRRFVDALDPPHRLSSKMGRGRDMVSVFGMHPATRRHGPTSCRTSPERTGCSGPADARGEPAARWVARGKGPTIISSRNA